MKLSIKPLLGTFSLILSGFAYAVPYKDCAGGMSINGMHDYWYKTKEQNNMVFNKEITNNGCANAAYYLVKLYHVKEPFGEEENTLLSIKDMAEQLLVYPSKLIVLPKRSASVTLTIPQGKQKDELSFYRVEFEPVIPEKNMGFNLDEEELDKIKAGFSLGMGFSTALVIEPKNPDYSYSEYQQDNIVTLKNEGNSLLFARFSGQCQKLDSQEVASNGQNPAHRPKAELLDVCEGGADMMEIRLYPDDLKKVDLSKYQKQATLIIQQGQAQSKHHYTVKPLE